MKPVAATSPDKRVVVPAREIGGSNVASEQLWQALDGASFPVVAYVTPTGEPRSSGVVYKTVDKRLL